ncbi:MAG: sugar ABC transporter ATP-binding protein [Pelolinea sp.]|nr:sugar ABC transporter ATP-binding protein [Pelolinea sp.]
MKDNLLEMKGITKIYPGVVALDKMDISVKRGEVHALLGENGAGKSTLIKILAGAVQRDEGEILFDGISYDQYSPNDAIQMGISVIYQEFNLVSKMSIEENIFFGKEHRNGIFLDRNAMIKKAREVFKPLGVEIDPREKISNLNVAYQQLVEIAKAILNRSKLIVMDEPSAALCTRELEILFKLIRQFKGEGTSIIYISHRLEEVFEIADRVTVLRDGKYVDTKLVSETNKDELIKLMVGRKLTGGYPQNNQKRDKVVLKVKGLTNHKLKNISFELRRNEILGITGLIGSGQTDLVRAIFGADPYIGEIFVKGKKVDIRSPQDAIRYGISYLPEDRKQDGILLEMSVRFNMSIASLKYYSHRGFIDKDKENKTVQKYVDAIRIKTPSFEQKSKNLSGGNQQKVILGKWLACASDIIIFDEPTRGIDVGAKQEIYTLMNNLVHEGKSIIIVSSELPELIGMSDRALVIYNGKITAELEKQELSQELILSKASTEGCETA